MKRVAMMGAAALGVAGAAAAAALALVRRLDGGGVAPVPSDDLTLEELRELMPRLPASKAQEYLPLLNVAMAEGRLFETVERIAAFLAQLAYESDQLTQWVEGASGAAYEGRSDLGNTVPGDGVRFKGRGPFQLTGRYNYERAGKALGIDLVGHPEDAAVPSVGFLIAAWYWNDRKLSAKADAGDFVGVTRGINGGTNGLAQRQLYYSTALRVLAPRRAA